MAEARQRADWMRVGVMAAASASAFGGRFEPLKFIPRCFRPEAEAERPKSAEEIEAESARAWRLVDRFFSKR